MAPPTVMKHTFIILLVVGALVACKKDKQPPARAVTAPTAAEAEAFAKEFAKAISPCNATELDRLIDTDLVLARSMQNRALSKSNVAGLKRGLGTMGSVLCRQISSPDTTLTYLRTLSVAGTPQPLLRLLTNGSLNYYQLTLDKVGNDIRVADIYFYLAAENMSDVIGKIIDLMLGAKGNSWELISTMQQLEKHMQNGEWQAAHDTFKRLPANFRNSKAVRLNEIHIAAELGDDVYVQAMESYAKAFPDDPSLALVQIDRAYLRKQYDEVLGHIDDLEKQVGGDAYLDVLRANSLSEAGRHADALAAAKRATDKEPTLQAAWWQRLTVEAADAKYDDALRTIDTLRDRFAAEITAEALAEDPRFGGLVESAEFKAWSAR